MASVLTFDANDTGPERQLAFSLEIGGKTYGFPPVLASDDLRRAYEAFGEIIVIILEALPAGTLAEWDLPRKLVRIHMELVPKPEPEGAAENVIQFPTGGHRAVQASSS